MKNKFKENKWAINWSIFALLLVLFISVCIIYENKSWVGNVLQTLGTVIGIYLTIIIFLFSKEDSDKQFREHLEHLQNLNAKHIEVLNATNQKQINSLHETANKQIQSYAEQTAKVIHELNDNSILLAEILKRQLEEAIVDFENRLSHANHTLKDLHGFKLLRTQEERTSQIEGQKTRLNSISQWLDYLRVKYNNVRKYLKVE